MSRVDGKRAKTSEAHEKNASQQLFSHQTLALHTVRLIPTAEAPHMHAHPQTTTITHLPLNRPQTRLLHALMMYSEPPSSLLSTSHITIPRGLSARTNPQPKPTTPAYQNKRDPFPEQTPTCTLNNSRPRNTMQRTHQDTRGKKRKRCMQATHPHKEIRVKKKEEDGKWVGNNT
jgi:hypothetical protein